MIVDMIAKGGMEFALKLWAARNLGAEPYMIRVGKLYVPDSWEMQECCIKFIEQHGTELIRAHCCEPIHIAHLCHVKEMDLFRAIDKLTGRGK